MVPIASHAEALRRRSREQDAKNRVTGQRYDCQGRLDVRQEHFLAVPTFTLYQCRACGDYLVVGVLAPEKNFTLSPRGARLALGVDP